MGRTVVRGSLRDRVLEYQRTGEGREELVREISEKAYRFPRHSMGWDEDACGDFLLFVYPRLAGLLDRFRDLGSPFEPYLASVLAWNLKSFARRKAEERAYRGADLRIAAAAEAEEAPEPEEPRGFLLDCGTVRQVLERQPENARRQFLFLLLKNIRSLDPAELRVLAGAAGMGTEALSTVLSRLEDCLIRREARLSMLRARRNGAFSRARLLEARLASEPDGDRREELRIRLEAARRRMRNAMDRMARAGTAPSNREIAAALGVPKGTVDSGLYWVKRRLAGPGSPDASRPA